jgi:ppGpp synthetase/RelA/SpoT-type nucleotidyltranferase
MQDIAGCRIVVPDIVAQERTLDAIAQAFAAPTVIDRRAQPSYGYRAFHIIVTTDEHLVEIQLRTSLQHLWAELSEKLAESVGWEIKYGGGPQILRELLLRISDLIFSHENHVWAISKGMVVDGSGVMPVRYGDAAQLDQRREQLEDERRKISDAIRAAIASLG